MIDPISVDRIQLLHPAVVQEVLDIVEICNAALTSHSEVRIVQGFRSFPQQQALYNQGRTTPGPRVTKAKPGQSYHNYGLAVDFCLLIDGKEISWDLKKDWDGDLISDWMEVVSIFTDNGWDWGATFSDNPHFDKKFNYTWQQLLAKYNKKDFIPGTNYVNL